MMTYHLHIKGRVQGVGFRPFVFSLANKLGLRGAVANTKEGVHIFVNATNRQLTHFIRLIRESAPPQSVITDLQFEEVTNRSYADFSIDQSDSAGEPDLLITPDFALCRSCRQELYQEDNRRHHYPFITCTQCGPRYSVIRQLPYDRPMTTMSEFEMCDSCREEYANPADRRFYSQTNSCCRCGVHLWVADRQGKLVKLEAGKEINFVCRKLAQGAVVAVKGVGGFLLMCDADNVQKVARLRALKQRPFKPFAMMYPNLQRVQDDFVLSEAEEVALCSAEAPIVLLQPKEKKQLKKLQKSMAPGLNRLGVMLPYAPVLELISGQLGSPLLATSANHKAAPIIYDNVEATRVLPVFADYILLNDREIVVPQDDSVLLFSPKKHQKSMIRRSRGFAPAFNGLVPPTSFQTPVLAMGALLKSTFCIWQNGRCHISQYLGDTTAFEAQLSYEHTLRHVRKLLHANPEAVIIDKHPAYYTSLLGKEIASQEDLKLYAVQHHEAHAWAVLGEHNLLDGQKVLVVVFDGTGMGNDGAIWGGEFFIAENHRLTRLTHLDYYPHILGDKMAREPRLSAFSLLQHFGLEYPEATHVFSQHELDLYTKVIDHATLMTSSMGRLFDAVASLLGLCHNNTFEGQAAMYLQCEAETYYRDHQPPEPYPVCNSKSGELDISQLLKFIINDKGKGVMKSTIAARFHESIVHYVAAVVDMTGCEVVAFSGGVFQNVLLIDRLIEVLGHKKALFFHEQLSPNDECVSYGQLVSYFQLMNQKELVMSDQIKIEN